MKKKLILLLLISFSATSFSQRKDSTTTTKADYLRKSNNQKTAAGLLTGGAIAISIGALLQDLKNVQQNASGSTGLYIGSAAMLTRGIILFIAPPKNRRRAENISFSINIKNAPASQQIGFSKKQFPAVGLSVHSNDGYSALFFSRALNMKEEYINL